MAYSNPNPSDCIQSDYTSSCRLNINGSSQEQKFIENLIVESIEIYGQDIYYLPRTLVNRDTVFGEDIDSQFDSARSVRGHMSIMLKDGKGKANYLANLEFASKIRQRLFSPVRSLKKKVDDLETLNVEGDQTKGT